MKHIKSIILAICTIILLILATPYISYKLTDDIDIAVSPVAQRIKGFNGEYYYSTPKGIYRCDDTNTLIAEGSYDSFCVDSTKLYCSDIVTKNKLKHNTVYVFDKMSGDELGSFESAEGLDGTISDGIMCVQSLQKVTNKSVLRFYDIYNGFKEVPVIYDRKFAGDATIFDFSDNRQPIVVSDSIYNEIITVAPDYIVCTRLTDDTDIVINYPDILARNVIHVGKFNTASDTADGLYISTTQNKSFFWENNKFSRTDLKHNRFDSVKTVEQRTGKITEKKNFRRTERVLRYDDNITITYYNGSYIYYDSQKFKEIKSIPADEIIDGGSYYVENYDGVTFIFDDNGDVIRKLYSLS